jgi:hypothetical protein
MKQTRIYEIFQDGFPPHVIELWKDLDFYDGETYNHTVSEYVGFTEDDDMPLDMACEQACEHLRKVRGKMRVNIGDEITFRVSW